MNALVFGLSKVEVRQKIGKPDDAGDEDFYLIFDSPDLMMMGMIKDENDSPMVSHMKPAFGLSMVRVSAVALVVASLAVMVAHAADVAALSKRYARDDQRVTTALRYQRNQAGMGEQVWQLETGEVIKVAVRSHKEADDMLDEYSLDEDGNVYFSFRKITTRAADGGCKVTEQRRYFDGSQTIQKTERMVELPAGVKPAMPSKTASVKSDLTKLAEWEKDNGGVQAKAVEVIKATCKPQWLVDDPAQGAPDGWQRIKLVEGSMSPDGRYALAWAPTKKDFVWDHYKAEDDPNDYWVEPETEPVVNFIADLKTHRVVGKTTGVHFGVKSNYNHSECVMAWSPDSSAFIELNTTKWEYSACGIGRLQDGVVVAMLDLGKAVEARAKALLTSSKHPGYRKYGKAMVASLESPELKNDGTGTIQVMFQWPKSEDDDAYATVRVSFRFVSATNALEMTGAALLKEE